MKSMRLPVGSSSRIHDEEHVFRWIVVTSQMELLSSIMKTKDSTLDTRRVRSTTFAVGFYCVLDGAFGVRFAHGLLMATDER